MNERMPQELIVSASWREDGLHVEPQEHGGPDFWAADSLKDIVQRSALDASFIDSNAQAFKITQDLQQDVLEKLSYVLTSQTGRLIRVVKA